MRNSQILMWLGILAVVVALGLGIGWLATRPTDIPPAPVAERPSNPAPAQPSTPENPRLTNHQTISRPRPVRPVIPVATPVTAPVTQGSNVVTNWEDRLDEILSSDDDDTNKVANLLVLFPQLPVDGQDEVAQHLSNLVEDEDYTPLGQLLLDARLPETVLDTLLADVLNRPNATKLPMFLEVAFTPNHPKGEESRELLELYLDEDFGTDRAKWQQAMDAWLKENPD